VVYIDDEVVGGGTIEHNHALGPRPLPEIPE
jgi:hypothetical protein